MIIIVIIETILIIVLNLQKLCQEMNFLTLFDFIIFSLDNEGYPEKLN